MNVLFFVEPKIERNDPYFRFATMRHSIIPQMEALRSIGHQTFVMFGAHLHRKLGVEGLDSRLGPHAVIKDADLSSISPNFRDLAQKGIAGDFTEGEIERLKCLILPLMPSGFEPDLIVVWESAVEYLRTIFPKAKVVYELPGPFSRAPFPDYTMMLPRLLSRIDVPSGTAIDGSFDDLRKQLMRGPLVPSSVVRRVSALRSEFDRLVLYALQIDHYFMVDEVLRPYGSQLGAIDWLLSQLPDSTGLVVTLYRSKGVSTDTMTEANLRYLRETYANFIFDDDLNSFENVSQALVPLVDGVVVASSSVAFQAALWKKPLLTLGDSHLSFLATARTPSEFVEQVETRTAPDRDSALAFMLDRHSVPNTFIRHHPDLYFSALLNVASGKATGRVINVQKLAAGISENLRVEPRKAGARVQDTRAFQDIIDIAARRPVVSFDIFDTLLVRPLAAPSDLFRYMEPFVEQVTGRRHLDFPAVRRAAEKKSFENALSNGRREILISEIYDEIASALAIAPEIASAIMVREVELETRLLYPRTSIASIFHDAVADGKSVYLISDMYLPEKMLSEVVRANGIKGFKSLILSSSHNAKKQSGELFKVFKKQIDVSADQVLHIGDNEIGDLKRAVENGLKAAHINKPWDTFKASWHYQNVWKRDEERHSLSLRTMLAVIANECYDDPQTTEFKGLFPRGRYDLGYAGFGPFLLSFTHWLIEKSRKAGMRKLYFLSRDGLIMKHAYDIVAKHVKGAPEAVYLYCSRRSANVARLKTFEDIIDLLMVDISAMTIERLLEVRFGLSPSAIEQRGIFPHYERLRKVRVKNETRQQAIPVLQELTPLILENASVERVAYLTYLDKVGFTDEEPKAVVDVGYAGTMQESLYELIDRREPISGFYLVTFRTALARCDQKGLPTEGFFGNFIDRHDSHLPFCRHIPLYESFFSNDQASLLRYRLTAEREPVPVFQPESAGEAERRVFSRQVHQGALDFVSRFSDVFGELQFDFDFEPMKGLRILREFFAHPTAVDAELMAGLVFEDNYGGGSHKTILRKTSSHKDKSVWVQGDEALYASKSPSVGAIAKAVPLGASRFRAGREEAAPLGWRKAFVRPVRPIVKIIGNDKDIAKYDKNPVKFFANLRSPVYRWMGVMIFGRRN